MHEVVRKSCCDYMEMNRHHFEHFILENFEHYIRRKRQPHTHGNHVEIQGQFFRLYDIVNISFLERFLMRHKSIKDNTPSYKQTLYFLLEIFLESGIPSKNERFTKSHLQQCQSNIIVSSKSTNTVRRRRSLD